MNSPLVRERHPSNTLRIATMLAFAVTWAELDLSLLLAHGRRAMASTYTQLQYDEMSGLVQTAGAASRMSEGWARMIGASQVTDEARHVEFFLVSCTGRGSACKSAAG